jgi:hypothetical protein
MLLIIKMNISNIITNIYENILNFNNTDIIILFYLKKSVTKYTF